MQRRSAPGIVAMLGRMPARISTSGLAESSERQKAISSATHPTRVYPRVLLKLAAWISIVMRLESSILSFDLSDTI